MEAKQRDLDLPTGLVSVVESEGFEDEAWDSFLRSTSVGQFQQSSAWARAKAIEGWRPERVTLRIGERILGGFQFLWRRTRLGRVGYVSKGPVLESEDPSLAASSVELLRTAATRLHCLAVIIQPPDCAKAFEPLLEGKDYGENKLIGVIDATLLVDLKSDMASLEQCLPRSTRRSLRQGKLKGLGFDEGSEAQLPDFFRLMSMTCARQKTSPNPATLDQLLQIWRAFSARRQIRLFFVTFQGQLVCGAISILFGERWTHWKKGWNGQHGRTSPNEFLDWNIMQAAGSAGFRLFDFCSLQRSTAEALLRGEEVPHRSISPRDRFNLSYGGRALLLPKSRVWIRHPILRVLYRLGVHLFPRS